MSKQMVSILAMLHDWYNNLESPIKSRIDAMFANGEYSKVVDEYSTYPGFPTSETVAKKVSIP